MMTLNMGSMRSRVSAVKQPAGLADHRVLDLSTGVAGAYCTKLLVDGGADAVVVEDPRGDPLRRVTACGAALGQGEDGALFRFLRASTASVVVDPDDPAAIEALLDAAAGVDAIVWSPEGALARLPGLAPAALREAAPDAVVCAVTPFGLDTPWTGRAASELTLQAWSGALAPRGQPEGPPVRAGGGIGEWVAGMFAAVGILVGWHRRAVTGPGGAGELVDVSALEGLAVTGAHMYPVTYMSIAGKPMRTGRGLNFPDVHRARDGYVGFMLVTGQQWLDFCALVGREDWMDDDSLVRNDNRRARRDEMLAYLDGWVAERAVGEILEVAEALRVPAAPVGDAETVLAQEHFVAQGMVTANPHGFVQPAPPWSSVGGPSPRPIGPAPAPGSTTLAAIAGTRRRAAPTKPQPTGDGDGDAHGDRARPFAGLRVADFTAFWAGPIVGHLLAMLGADVVKVESARRPDGMRGHTTKAMTEDRWWEWAPAYQGANVNKRGITLDLSTDAGRAVARRLCESADVVVENYAPRVFDGWGLRWDDLAAANPGLVLARLPAFGLGGPWRDRTGYAQTQEQASGLAWLTGTPDGPPIVPNGICDPIAGTHATVALLIALAHRRRTGEGCLLEVPMVGSALNVGAQQLVEHSAYGARLERMANRSPGLAPEGVYRAADADTADDREWGRWVAVSVLDDDGWRALRTALGDPAWAADPALESLAGRHAAHDRIDAELAAWCGTRSAADAVAALDRPGVAAAVVQWPFEQAGLPPLVARDFFEDVTHPLTGSSPHGGYPARSSAGPARWHRRPAPMLGEHNVEVLTELGYTDAEIATLEGDGVIGTCVTR